MERREAIETLVKLRMIMEVADRVTSTNERKEALDMAIASFKNETYQLEYEEVQNIVIAEGMTNAEVFTKIYGYQPATDSVVCNKDDWCGKSEPCKYCSCVGDSIGREEDWWASPYKKTRAKI